MEDSGFRRSLSEMRSAGSHLRSAGELLLAAMRDSAGTLLARVWDGRVLVTMRRRVEQFRSLPGTRPELVRISLKEQAQAIEHRSGGGGAPSSGGTRRSSSSSFDHLALRWKTAPACRPRLHAESRGHEGVGALAERADAREAPGGIVPTSLPSLHARAATAPAPS